MKINQTTLKKHQGLSLIEMMVSMVLGLFLVLGLTSMYMGSKKSDKVRDAVSRIEENARMTLNTLRSAIEHAGYKSVDNIPLDKPFYTPSDGALQNENCGASAGLITNNNLLTPPTALDDYTKDGDVDDGESDMLTVVFRADNPDKGPIYFDCSGEAYVGLTNPVAQQKACSTDPLVGVSNPWKSRILNMLYINQADKTLHCMGSRSATGSIVLASGIENMQIRYGVTTTNSLGERQTTYKKANDVEANNEWEAVTSVQAAILVASQSEVLDKAETHSFTLLDEDIDIAADRKIYRQFSTTINLPNRARRKMQQVSRTSEDKS